MYTRLLEIGAGFDWISPMLSVLDEIFFGPNYTFLIPICSVTGRQITHALHKKGISTGTSMIVDNTIMIDVRMKHAVRAQMWLIRWGIPIENPLPKKKVPQKRAPKKPKGRKTIGSYSCRYCFNRYKTRRTKCPNCGAPM